MKARLPVCPYCYQIFGPGDKKTVFKNNKGECSCPKCNKVFFFEKHTEIIFYTKKTIQPKNREVRP